ncbi:MAG: hypothetical protein ACTSUF_03475 [Candidatus Heimdallarchaeaceae archaeon]
MGAIPLTEIGKAIAYDAPSTSTHVVQIKKASYMKGEYPEHLKAYAGQIKDCPVKCKGKTGLTYAACLRKCAAKVKKGK